MPDANASRLHLRIRRRWESCGAAFFPDAGNGWVIPQITLLLELLVVFLVSDLLHELLITRFNLR